MSLTHRCIRDASALPALQAEWDELLQNGTTGSPFCAYAWCVTWWRVFGQEWQPEVHVWSDAVRTVAILPLVRRTRLGWIREVSFMSGPEVAPEQLDALVLAGAESAVANALAAFLEELKQNCDVLRFADLAPDGILAGALRDGTSGDDTFAVIVPSPAQAGVDLTGTFDAYFAGRGAKVRRNFRHSCRAFEADHNARPQWVKPESTEHALACFERLWSLHNTSFKRREEFDYFQSEQIRDFHRTVLASPGILELVRFATVASPEEIFGSLYCLVHRRRLYCYQKGFDAAVEKLSPGFILVGAAIQAAFLEGCTYFDFLRGDEAYKQRWANAKHYTIGYTQSMDTVPAALWHAAAGLHGSFRKLKRALRRSVPNETTRVVPDAQPAATPVEALAR